MVNYHNNDDDDNNYDAKVDQCQEYRAKPDVYSNVERTVQPATLMGWLEAAKGLTENLFFMSTRSYYSSLKGEWSSEIHSIRTTNNNNNNSKSRSSSSKLR